MSTRTKVTCPLYMKHFISLRTVHHFKSGFFGQMLPPRQVSVLSIALCPPRGAHLQLPSRTVEAPSPTLIYIYTYPKLLVIYNLFTTPYLPSAWGKRQMEVEDKQTKNSSFAKLHKEILRDADRHRSGGGKVLLHVIPIHQLKISQQETGITLRGVLPRGFLPPRRCTIGKKNTPLIITYRAEQTGRY